jgi:hypothetical protein
VARACATPVPTGRRETTAFAFDCGPAHRCDTPESLASVVQSLPGLRPASTRYGLDPTVRHGLVKAMAGARRHTGCPWSCDYQAAPARGESSYGDPGRWFAEGAIPGRAASDTLPVREIDGVRHAPSIPCRAVRAKVRAGVPETLARLGDGSARWCEACWWAIPHGSAAAELAKQADAADDALRRLEAQDKRRGGGEWIFEHLEAVQDDERALTDLETALAAAPELRKWQRQRRRSALRVAGQRRRSLASALPASQVEEAAGAWLLDRQGVLVAPGRFSSLGREADGLTVAARRRFLDASLDESPLQSAARAALDDVYGRRRLLREALTSELLDTLESWTSDVASAVAFRAPDPRILVGLRTRAQRSAAREVTAVVLAHWEVAQDRVAGLAVATVPAMVADALVLGWGPGGCDLGDASGTDPRAILAAWDPRHVWGPTARARIETADA